jgi:hypothetical protein
MANAGSGAAVANGVDAAGADMATAALREGEQRFQLMG